MVEMVDIYGFLLSSFLSLFSLAFRSFSSFCTVVAAARARFFFHLPVKAHTVLNQTEISSYTTERRLLRIPAFIHPVSCLFPLKQ